MAKKPETRFKEKIQGILKKLRTKTNKLKFEKIQQKAIRGTPDFIICAGGFYVEWELKVGKGKADPLQLYNIEQTAKAGGHAWVVYPANLKESFFHLFKIAGIDPRLLDELDLLEEFL